MSSLTADGFGIKPNDEIGCIGKNIELYKKCILALYKNENMWKKYRQNGFKFVQQTHSRRDVTKVWDVVINENLNKMKKIREEGDTHKMDHQLLTTELNEPKEQCPEGEKLYAHRYPTITEAIAAGEFKSHFHHYELHGKREGRVYMCIGGTNADSTRLSTSKLI